MRKPPSPIQAERKRARALLRSYIKRGYQYSKEFVKRILEGKRTKQKTYEAVTPEALQKKGRAFLPSGKKVSGTEYRKFERSESAKRGAETRKTKAPIRTEYTPKLSQEERDRWTEDVEREYREQERRDRQWEQERRKQDFIDYEKASQYNEAREVYLNLQGMIDEYEAEYPQGANILRQSLKKEIAKYGEAGVIKSISKAPGEVLETARRIIYYSGKSDTTGYLQLMNLIRAEIPTLEEKKLIGLITDSSDSDY